MLHLFDFENHEPGAIKVVCALILAIPFCLAWTLMLAGRNQQPVTSVVPAYARPTQPEHIPGKLSRR